MRKIKNEVFSKLHNKMLTGIDISVFLEIARYQDEYGNVKGVYYKDVTETLSISNQTYYTSLQRLGMAGLVSVEKNNYYDRDVKIIDNSYYGSSYKKNNTEGYVSLSAAIYSSEEFRKLRAGAKLLAMHCMLFYQRNNRTYQVGKEKFMSKYTKLLHVTRRIINSYLADLKKLFSIGIKDGKYYITPRSEYSSYSHSSDNELYYNHELAVAVRRNKADVKEETKNNIISLLVIQYIKKIKEKRTKINLCEIVEQCLWMNNRDKKKSEWNMELGEKLFHKQLKTFLTTA